MSKVFDEKINIIKQENKEHINRLVEEQRKEIDFLKIQSNSRAEISSSSK